VFAVNEHELKRRLHEFDPNAEFGELKERRSRIPSKPHYLEMNNIEAKKEKKRVKDIMNMLPEDYKEKAEKLGLTDKDGLPNEVLKYALVFLAFVMFLKVAF